MRDEIHELEQEIFALAGDRVPDRLARAAGGDPVREARPLAQAPRQDRLLHRRARIAGDPLRARDRAADRALARALHADQDLPGRAPRAGRRAARASTPRSCRRSPRPGGCRAPTRTCRTSPSAPSSGARSAAASRPPPERADLRRLLPDRAARARPRRRRLGAEGDLPPRRGRPHRHRLAGVRRGARGDRPGDALEVEDDQLRHRLRPLRLWSRRPPEHPARGGQGVHRRLPAALPPGRGVHRAHDRAGQGGRSRHDAVGPAPPDPRAARAQLPGAHARRAPGRQHRHPGHRRGHHQARDGPLPRRACGGEGCERD